jgi:diguanylate cyclase (GGDEF)-like protein
LATERLVEMITLKSRRLVETAKQEANTCSQTGLHNRRYFDVEFPGEIDRARRQGRPLSLALIDIDHFRLINKHHGWPTGDRVLQAFAGVVRDNVRATDWVARYGGEEFVIVMPDTTLASAAQVAERVRKAFSSGGTESVDGQRVAATLSTGVAQLLDCMDSTTAFVQQASKALLRAKESGRNRVEQAHADRGPGLAKPTVCAGDPFDLERFVEAQADVYVDAVIELRRGRKRSHWMWFVFPQLRALGRSATAQHFGLASIDEARAYWAHPLLGPRLKACTQRVLALEGRTALMVFGMPDALKFCSSMTLFERAAPHEPVFAQALDKFYAGRRDAQTLALL